MTLIIGVDDAGRGPVIGPMVLAGVLIERKDEAILKEWGAKDSKKLIPEKREEIAKKIFERFETAFTLVSPEEIDSREKVGTNLNWIEAVKAAQIINILLKDKNEEAVAIIDCPSPNTEAWKNYLKKYIDNSEKVKLVVEHKADVNHISCSAASIIAKVTRDSEIEKIKKEIGKDFGSGYCSDPVTCKFIEENMELMERTKIIRTSWDTFSRIKGKKQQKKLLDF